MPYPSGTLRFIMKGTIYGVQDWSIGICARTDSLTAYGYDVLQVFLAANSSIFTTFYNAVSAMRSSQVTFTTLRLEQYIGAEEAFTINEVAPMGQVVGSQPAVHPAYAAICLGTLTGRPGGSFRGRAYLPALSANLGATTGAISATDQGVVRNAFATLISAINDLTISTNPVTAVVASRTTVSSAPITQVRSDQILDVQRRRNNDFTRAYVTSPIT